VTVASVGKPQITASRGTRIVADTTLDTCADRTFDMIAVPGGMPGAQTLAQSKVLVDLLKKQAQEGRWIAAICAAPAVVLQAHGLLEGIRATCHPAFYNQIAPAYLSKDRVVVDRNVITAQGAGVAIDFALTLVEHLVGRDKKKEVAAAMVVPGT
jgi:4-methyl-5(b-hydroxyethyl)-thiazole monophosphate biosynthesis